MSLTLMNTIQLRSLLLTFVLTSLLPLCLFSFLCLVGHFCDSQAFLRRHISKQKRGFLLLCNQTFTISMCRKPPICGLIPDLFSSPRLNLLIRHFQLINVPSLQIQSGLDSFACCWPFQLPTPHLYSNINLFIHLICHPPTNLFELNAFVMRFLLPSIPPL